LSLTATKSPLVRTLIIDAADFDALLGKSRAIVTEIPGTTRDALEAVIDGGTWPLRLVDTAGLRSTDNRLERLGIEVSERYLSDAQAVLVCAETNEGLAETVSAVSSKSAASIIRVRTKGDLVAVSDKNRSRTGTITVSAETGSGLQELLGASMYILSWIGMRNAPPNPQAKMMMYMFPVMMTVVLLNMASGLNLYYTAQNIAALPQQWLLARERAKARVAR